VFNLAYCEELDISCNEVGDLATKCLAEFLQVSCTPFSYPFELSP
jgi:hypothetical protein